MNSPATRDVLKLAARRLFASRGIDGVSIRDIVKATDLKNSGSLHYYFGTKEALVRELIVDGARIMDERRNAILDRMEANGGPATLRDVLAVLVYPATGLEEDGADDTYNRFIVILQLNHRSLFMDALAGRWNIGYARCQEYIRGFLSELDPKLVNQRLVFLHLYLGAVISAREGALASGARDFWAPDATLEHFIDTVEGMLTQPAGPPAKSGRRAVPRRTMARP